MGPQGGTVGRADIYGLPSNGNGSYSPISVINPNGDAVSPSTATASGGGQPAGTGAATVLIASIMLLVGARLLIHLLGEDG